MFAFSEGAKLITELLKYVGKDVQVKIDFGLENHMMACDCAELKLDEVDTLIIGEEGKPLTTDHLNQVVDHMEKLKDHEVFRCGRSFYQEGFHVYNSEGGYLTDDDVVDLIHVCLRWGS